MTILHTVNKSPFERSALETCLQHALPGSAILLIEDGVYGALSGTAWSERVQNAIRSVPVYALQADIEARGLAGRVLAGVQPVDYGGFVDLAAQHAAVQAWL